MNSKFLMFLIPILLMGLGFAIFQSRATTSVSVPPVEYELDATEEEMVDSLDFHHELVAAIRGETDATIHKFYQQGNWKNTDEAVGITFSVDESEMDRVYMNLSGLLATNGYQIFYADLFEQYQLAVIESDNPYDILRVMDTNGYNYDIGPEEIIDQLKKWDQYSVTIVGAGFDWLLIELGKLPKDMSTMIEEAYEVCPDLVTMTPVELEEAISEDQMIFFWWD